MESLLCKVSLYTVINKKCGWPFLKTKREQVKCSNPECKDKRLSDRVIE